MKVNNPHIDIQKPILISSDSDWNRVKEILIIRKIIWNGGSNLDCYQSVKKYPYYIGVNKNNNKIVADLNIQSLKEWINDIQLV